MMQSQTGRVLRRQHIVSPAAKEFKREAKKKPQIQYYHQDPDKRNNKFRGGSASKSWDKVTNEMPFASSVPTTMKGMFPQKPSKHYRDLERVVDTLDSVGTKAASPTHLIYENGAKHDYGHIGSRVSHIWKAKGGVGGGTGKGGKGRGRRPSEYLLEGLLAQQRGVGASASVSGGANDKAKKKG